MHSMDIRELNHGIKWFANSNKNAIIEFRMIRIRDGDSFMHSTNDRLDSRTNGSGSYYLYSLYVNYEYYYIM